jgi:hypothetical protein
LPPTRQMFGSGRIARPLCRPRCPMPHATASPDDRLEEALAELRHTIVAELLVS